jgi:DNA primase
VTYISESFCDGFTPFYYPLIGAHPVKFSSSQIKEIRHTLNLADIIARQVPLKVSGGKLKGRCPFHDEKTPSFFVDAAQGRYYCFGCGAKGDVFDYLMLTEGLSFADAVKKAAFEAGVELQKMDPHEEREMRRREAVRNSLFSVNEKAAEYFENQLNSSKGREANEYLSQRGLGKKIIKKFRLGYAPDEWSALSEYLTSQDKIKQAIHVGLIKTRNKGNGTYDFYRHRIMFPIIDTSGRIRGFSSRILDSSRKEGKYVNSSESSIFVKNQSLFGLYNAKNSIRRNGNAIVVEGNIDVITLAQEGYPETVAPLGTALTKNQLKLIKRFTKNVTTIFDGDRAGKDATKKTIPSLLELGIGGKIVLLNESDDPDSFMRREGKVEFDKLIKRSLPPIDAYMEMVLAPRNSAVSVRLKSLENLKTIWGYLSDVEKDMYSEEIGIKIQLDSKKILGILEQFNGEVKYASTPVVKEIKPPVSKIDGSNPEIVAILHVAVLALTSNSPLHPSAESAIANSFTSESATDLWRMIVAIQRPVSDSVLSELFGVSLFKQFIELRDSFSDILSGENDSQEKILEDVIASIKKKGLKQRSQMIDFQLKRARTEGDKSKVIALLNEKLSLQKERIEL